MWGGALDKLRFVRFVCRDVSFEKRILPSRTQSRERRFLDEDSDNGGRVASDQTLSRKVNEAIEVILPLKEKRLHFKECETALKIKKDKKMKKGIKERVGADEKLNKKGGGRSPVERSETVEAKNIKLPDAVVFLKKEGSAAETFPKRDSEIKKHKSKKLDKDKEHSKKPKDGGSKNREKDGSKGVKIKKKRKSISEDVESRDGNAKHSSKEEKLESQQQETLALLPLRTSGDVPVSSPSFPSRKPSSPGPEVRQHDNPPLVKPSSLLPPPSSPDKSPMFDNSDDEFPELVIDVPMWRYSPSHPRAFGRSSWHLFDCFFAFARFIVFPPLVCYNLFIPFCTIGRTSLPSAVGRLHHFANFATETPAIVFSRAFLWNIKSNHHKRRGDGSCRGFAEIAASNCSLLANWFLCQVHWLFKVFFQARCCWNCLIILFFWLVLKSDQWFSITKICN